tara:strand:+ start:822 stop:1067 length:246 start_codon:yes stop_codon:yes gene_type:complete
LKNNKSLIGALVSLEYPQHPEGSIKKHNFRKDFLGIIIDQRKNGNEIRVKWLKFIIYNAADQLIKEMNWLTLNTIKIISDV